MVVSRAWVLEGNAPACLPVSDPSPVPMEKEHLSCESRVGLTARLGQSSMETWALCLDGVTLVPLTESGCPCPPLAEGCGSRQVPGRAGPQS